MRWKNLHILWKCLRGQRTEEEVTNSSQESAKANSRIITLTFYMNKKLLLLKTKKICLFIILTVQTVKVAETAEIQLIANYIKKLSPTKILLILVLAPLSLKIVCIQT
jgi:hypothetical protein